MSTPPIPRYNIYPSSWGPSLNTDRSADGGWVKYDDHLASVNAAFFRVVEACAQGLADMQARAEKAEAKLALEVEDHARDNRDNRDNRGTSRGLEAEIHQLKERRSQLALQVNDHRSQAESLLSRWGELSRERDHLAERCKLVDEMTTRTEKAEQLAADLAGIPKVAGHLRISLAEMIRNAGTLLTEAEITAAHVPLAPFLCDVIRVCREYGDAMQVRT